MCVPVVCMVCSYTFPLCSCVCFMCIIEVVLRNAHSKFNSFRIEAVADADDLRTRIRGKPGRILVGIGPPNVWDALPHHTQNTAHSTQNMRNTRRQTDERRTQRRKVFDGAILGRMCLAAAATASVGHGDVLHSRCSMCLVCLPRVRATTPPPHMYRIECACVRRSSPESLDI